MKPIIFNSEMVRAILDGRKTQTRRVIKNMPEFVDCCFVKKGILEVQYWGKNKINYQPDMPANDKKILIKCPYGKIGDELWVRESFAVGKHGKTYKATWNNPERINIKWKPSIHMPKKYARIFLEITNIRVERVQDITEYDAKAEGVKEFPKDFKEQLYYKCFRDLWNSINEKRGFGFNSNPYVWVLGFKKV